MAVLPISDSDLCTNDPGLHRQMQRINENAKDQKQMHVDLATLFNHVANFYNVGPTVLNNQPASYYLNYGNFTGVIQNASTPIRRAITQGGASAGVISVKFYEWGGSSYAASGSAFNAYDVFNCYPHCAAGDLGLIAYDAVRGVWVIDRLNTPLVRTGVLNGDAGDGHDTDLGSGASANANVKVGSVNYLVYGHQVPDGKSIPKASDTSITFYYDFGEAKYIAISSNKCAA